MKRVIFLLAIIMPLFFVSCGDDEKDEQNKIEFNNNFFLDIYAKDIVNEAGEYIQFSTGIYLFESDGVIFEKEQSQENLKEYNAVDEDGILRHANYSSVGDASHLVQKIKPGKYFLHVVIIETGKYSNTYIEIKENKDFKLEKVFESSLPKNSYEEWN